MKSCDNEKDVRISNNSVKKWQKLSNRPQDEMAIVFSVMHIIEKQ